MVDKVIDWKYKAATFYNQSLTDWLQIKNSTPHKVIIFFLVTYLLFLFSIYINIINFAKSFSR